VAAEAIPMPIPEPMHASVHVEEVHIPRSASIKRFFRNNQDTLLILSAIVASVWVTRILIRKDIKNINFTAEFYPDWMYDAEGEFVGMGD
jgi:hypothetical protein